MAINGVLTVLGVALALSGLAMVAHAEDQGQTLVSLLIYYFGAWMLVIGVDG